MGLSPVSSLVLVFLAALVPSVAGHAFLAVPISRNLYASNNGIEKCAHCLQAGGPKTVSERADNSWPTVNVPESHGLCGDPVQNHPVEEDWRNEEYLNPTPVQATYYPGQIVEFEIGVSTHHMGHYEFRICDQALSGNITSRRDGQDCLNAHILKRCNPADCYSNCQANDPNADCQPYHPEYPERWFLPPPGQGTQVAGLNWQDNLAAPVARGAEEVHRMKYIIPQDLHCTHCTLQWYWSTGNSCLYDEGYFKYFRKMKELGWNAEAWSAWSVASWANCDTACCGGGQRPFGEEFWNCADIAVLPSGSPSPTPTPGSNPAPTPATPAPAPAPKPTPGPCSSLWQQCGGNEWTGYTCCKPGSKCNRQNEYYHQCVPGNPDPTPAPMPAPTSAPQPAPTPSPSGTCSCAASTVWDGNFAQFVGDSAAFCSQNFGQNNPYISAGGGGGASGGHSGSEPCASGQYSFSEAEGWKIEVTKSQGQGKVPYRAFAYVQFCNGQANCWVGKDKVSFHFSFKTDGMDNLGAYVKLLFWTDSGNILGLLPPKHPKGENQFRLLAFMQDDYPNSWSEDMVIQDGTWYHVQVDFFPATSNVGIKVNGNRFTEGSVPVNMLSINTGPQIGIYSFDYGSSWPDTFTLWLDDACVGETSGTCPSGGDGAPTPTPTPMPTPAPTPLPTLTTTTTSLVACELEGNAKTCASQGGSYECNSCGNDITEELCCSCQSGAVSSTTLVTTTSSTSAGLCKSWCVTNTKSWEKKCRWNKCAGCPACFTRRLRGSDTLFQ